MPAQNSVREVFLDTSLIDDEIVINLQRTQVYVFSDSVLFLGKVLQHPESNEAWKNRVAGIRSEKSYRDYDVINGESTEFEWIIFPGFTSLQLCDKISNLLMSGIICSPCSISAILALLLAPHRRQNELNKNQEKDVSQQNHDL